MFCSNTSLVSSGTKSHFIVKCLVGKSSLNKRLFFWHSKTMPLQKKASSVYFKVSPFALCGISVKTLWPLSIILIFTLLYICCQYSASIMLLPCLRKNYSARAQSYKLLLTNALKKPLCCSVTVTAQSIKNCCKCIILKHNHTFKKSNILLSTIQFLLTQPGFLQWS